MLLARAELYSDTPGWSSDEAIAEREALRKADEARATGQGALDLRLRS